MSDKKLELPSRAIEVEINGTKYPIKFPSNGQFIDIERMKIDLTNGNLKTFIFGTPNNQMAYLLTEAIATFSVLIPDLAKDLSVKSLLDLDPFQSKPLLKAYENVYYPWIEAWRKVINEVVEQDEEENKNE